MAHHTMHTHTIRPAPAPRPTRWRLLDVLTGALAATGAILLAATLGGAL